MPNCHRGEIAARLDGRDYTLCLTLGALAEMEAAFSARDLNDIAARFDISLNAVSKHIMVLAQAGLVTRRTKWREHLIEVQLDPLQQAFRWFNDLRSIWDLRLDALESHFTKDKTDD